MTARKIGRHWFVDFHFKGERIRERSPVDTKRGAEEHERQLRAKLLNPEPEKKEVPTFATFAEEFMATYVALNNKPSEQRAKAIWLNKRLVPFFGKMKLDEITVRDIERFKAQLTCSLKTQKNILTVFAKLMSYALEAEVIDRKPKVRMPKLPVSKFDFFDFEESDRLVQAARDHFPEWAAMVFVALRTGLRFGELIELRWEDVDVAAGRLLVRRSFAAGKVGTPKSGRSREVPLSGQTVSVLKKHRHLRDLVFSHGDGSRITHKVAYRVLHSICRRAGLRTVGWHTLRHSFASHLVALGRSLKEAQELLGHSDYGQTLRYAHLAPEAKRDAVSVLDREEECQSNTWAIGGQRLGSESSKSA